MSSFVVAGLTTCDLVYFVDELPSRGGKATASDARIDVGGPAANAARTAAGLGAGVVLHTVVGDGPLSTYVIDLLNRSSVPAVDHASGNSLPLASVWVDGTGERTILSTDNRRSAVTSRMADIDFDGVAAVLLDGHYPDLQTQIAEGAVAAEVPIVLDCGRWREVFSDLLPVATDVIMSERFRPPELADAPPAVVVEAIGEVPSVSLCAMTRGAKPILVAAPGGAQEIWVEQVDVVDSNGAGDVLHGGYLYYRYAEGNPPADAIARAARLASESCRVTGLDFLTDRNREPAPGLSDPAGERSR